MDYELIGTFAGGILSGLAAAYGYWKTIPLKKRKAAISDLKEGIEDGELNIVDVLDAVEELM